MKEYMISVFAITALLSLLSHISYKSSLEKTRRLAFGVILLSIVVTPAAEAVTGLADFNSEDLLPGIDQEGGESDALYEAAFAEGISSAICDKFELRGKDVRVLIVGFVKDEWRCERIRIILSGTAAFADTAASGIGMISKKAFDPFRMKRVNAGISGGMSLLGTASSLVAPFAFLLISLAFDVLDVKLWLLCAAFAFSGALFDSLLGSLVQVKFKCKICGEITEKELHCEEKTDKISGIKIINNDAVNFISCLAASLLSVGACILTVG